MKNSVKKLKHTFFKQSLFFVTFFWASKRKFNNEQLHKTHQGKKNKQKLDSSLRSERHSLYFIVISSPLYQRACPDVYREGTKGGFSLYFRRRRLAGMSILMTIIRRRDLKGVRNLIESIDKDAFITIQHSRPYRGFIPGVRK